MIPMLVERNKRRDSMEKKSGEENDSAHLEMIQKLIQSIQYGTVSVIVQDGKVVQIEKNEKYRIRN